MPASSSQPLEFIHGPAGNDAVTLLETIHRSLSCNTEQDFIDLFPKIQEMFPFDFAIAFLVSRDDGRIMPVDGVDISFPAEFFEEYHDKGYLHSDLLIRESLATRGVQYWPDAWERLDQKKGIISLCTDCGMEEGCIHGSRAVFRTKHDSIFCFSGSSIRHDDASTVMLELLIPHLHLALSDICGNRRPCPHMNSIDLSVREKEVLNWLKHGKSSWDISVILGISESTVNYHVYNVMLKLDVVNRPQAVAAAVRLGLIDFG